MGGDKEVHYCKKEANKTEFSKKLLYVIFGVTGLIILFSMVMVFITRDLSPLSYLIPALFVEVGVATGFYYNKAKEENMIKLKMIYGEELVEKEDRGSDYEDTY